MKKSMWKASVLFVLLAGFAALSFGAQAAPVKYKLTLENGKIIEGEIVAQTATTISIKDATLGVIAIARENILKIEPPLNEAKTASVTPPPAAAPRIAAEPYAQPTGGMGNISFGFSLSGAFGNIDGGDFNQYIRDTNTYLMDVNDYYGGDYYTVDWKEMKWLSQFGGEFSIRFGRNFGIGLGAEYISKTNPGTIDYVYEDHYNVPVLGIAYIAVDDISQTTHTISQKLTVIPITLSLYGFLPLGPSFEGYVKAGVGYYLGKLSNDWLQESSYEYNENWYYNNGTVWPPHYHETGTSSSDETVDVTCNTLGFHFGAGFNYNVTSNIAIFGEAFYRMANFKDWQGSGVYDYQADDYWGWTNSTSPNNLPSHATTSYSDDWNGTLWSYLDLWDFLDTGEYLVYGLYEAGDEPEENSWTSDVRKTEININGFTFKVGLRISFGGRR